MCRQPRCIKCIILQDEANERAIPSAFYSWSKYDDSYKNVNRYMQDGLMCRPLVMYIIYIRITAVFMISFTVPYIYITYIAYMCIYLFIRNVLVCILIRTHMLQIHTYIYIYIVYIYTIYIYIYIHTFIYIYIISIYIYLSKDLVVLVQRLRWKMDCCGAVHRFDDSRNPTAERGHGNSTFSTSLAETLGKFGHLSKTSGKTIEKQHGKQVQ